MNPLYVEAGVAGAFALLFLWGLVQTQPDPAAIWRARYLNLMRLSEVEGRAHLAQRLEALSQRFPGKSYTWYLRWLVNDLERAKRP